MKLKLSALLIIFSLFKANSQTETANPQTSKMTINKDTVITDTLSYALGTLLGTSIKSQGFNELNLDDLNKGILHAILNMSQYSVQQCDNIVRTWMTEKQQSEFGPVKEAGEKFLAENLKKPNVNITKSGLQYEIITEGTGKKPGPADSVKVHYEGSTIDGNVFDSSIKRGEPITLMTNQVIQGWTEALQLMKEGAKYKLYIPYYLGYGENGAGQAIPPYSTLIFEVQLLKVGS
ncbi:MAG: FKBP-type peptidyl-prolyl cis-trans isomerase [Saprospiraceae bacterium]